MAPPGLIIEPPLLNSATPWATDLENLRDILTSPSTGAVTTRTSMLHGFQHEHDKHRYLFFNPGSGMPDKGTSSTAVPPVGNSEFATGSLNNLGYSPITLDGYLDFLKQLSKDHPQIRKTIIVSVTGPPEEIQGCCAKITAAAAEVHFPLAMEINLSCPNIPDKPPPAYDGEALAKYLAGLPRNPTIPIGVKTPPYTYHGQFTTFIGAVKPVASSLSFVTATNTLGSCLILQDDLLEAQLPQSGVGGMAGTPLHPLALGNVKTLRQILDETPELSHIKLIGVGGVRDGDGYRRMKAVGAYAVAVGTAIGKQGKGVFERIKKDIDSKW